MTVLIGEELVVPGLPELRRANDGRRGDAGMVSAELKVRVVRPLTVSREERRDRAAPAVVARVVDAGSGLLGPGAEPGDLVVLYSEALGNERRFRWLLRRGRRARSHALVETLPALREFGGHPL